MTFALIFNGAVAEIAPATFPVNDALVWADVSAVSPAPQPGWTATGTVGAWTFAAPVPPTLSLADQAAAQLATRIAAGIAITSTGTPALNATYALDQLTMDQIGPVARDFASGFGLPGGASAFTYPDATGQPRSFTGAQIVALYKAQRDLLFTLNTNSAIMAHGGSPVWSPQTAVIV